MSAESYKINKRPKDDVSDNDDDDMKFEINNKEFNDKCKSISLCPSICRIIKYLEIHQTIEITKICDIFNHENTPYLADDFNHILTNHLSDYKSIEETKEEYEKIYEYITDKIKGCKLMTCPQFQRNNRCRETENILLVNNKDDNYKKIDYKTEYYVEIMDTIHCFFIHSYDVGFRLNSNDLKNILSNHHKTDDQNDEDDEDDYCRDSTMLKLTNLVCTKREKLREIRGASTFEKTKFVTEITNKKIESKDDKESCLDGKEEKKEKKEEIEETANEYSFGYRWHYWDDDEWTPWWAGNFVKVHCKYNNLHDELLNNNIFTIDIEKFNIIKTKATEKMRSNYGKKIRSRKSFWREHYKIDENATITIPHIMSVLFYTDFSELSYHFSSTFRTINESETFEMVKKRNTEFANMSKLLAETVNAFGTEIEDLKIKMYYHGISKLLIFKSLVTYYDQPTSTTVQQSVAAIFAKENGAVLSLQNGGKALCYFNCSWLSSFCNEDERLFMIPYHHHASYQKLQIVSIISIRRKEDYSVYIHALSTLHYATSDIYVGEDQPNHSVKKVDNKVIKKLINHRDEGNKYKNKFPKYINNLFNAFIQNVKEVDILSTTKLLKALFDENKCFKMNDFISIFDHCENVTVWYKGELRNNKVIDKHYLDNLESELALLSKTDNKTLKYIRILFVKTDKILLESYKSRFIELKWEMVSIKDDQFALEQE